MATTTTDRAPVISFVSRADQRKQLRLVSARLDVPMSEVIRGAIDEYLEKTA
jgi:hypothetical protein